ncbi:hypothetical protein [Fictibacillus sp. 18YEL24]|uniref:hypothetical protein n=1 Tax=Fictibacillus sp. 18YEL24 TaxID=2745875 RepID=UPI0018CF2917|nr:hypothetical protein [Fictibacillus sp. 18YEL24]MBH0168233.1 hypothetical protein [Fictibacillus sp. 18YEL24]
MAKKGLIGLVLTLILISGFFTYYILNAKPPSASAITEANITIPVKQGSYCWDGFLNGECKDMVEPFMMNDIEPVTVAPREKIEISYNRKPVKISKEVMVWSKSQSDPKSVNLEDGTIVAPQESGTYAVSTYGNWKRGSASHVFFIKVK